MAVIAICGDRHIDPIKHIAVLTRAVMSVIDGMDGITGIVTGDALGVDAFVRRAARLSEESLTVFCADKPRAELLRQEGYTVRIISDWRENGKSAGPIRNRAMLSECDEVILLDGGGPGSESVFRIAYEMKKPIHHFLIERTGTDVTIRDAKTREAV